MAPEHPPTDPPRAAAALRQFIEDRGLSLAKAATAMGKAKSQIVGWCKGVTPEPHNAEHIEAFCAVVDPRTKKPRRNSETGQVVSRVPYEWWWPEGQAPKRPSLVRPYDARAAEAP